jgi:glycosyltransferase involved in cell wall biosynthesis
MSARLTIAIPFYSTPEYLKAAIDSVVAQTLTEWELVIVDDKSPHTTIEALVKSYNDPRMRYQKNAQNLGQAGNWNRCLDAVTTEFVTLLHADDELMPSYAETVLGLIDAQPQASAVFCSATIIDGKGKKIFSFADAYKARITPKGEPIVLRGQDGLCTLLRGNIIMCPTMCYRRSRLFGERFEATWKTLPDLDFTTRLLLAGGSLVGTHEKAFRYRRHDESGTAQTQRNLRMFEDEASLYDSLAKRAAARGWDRAARLARNKNVIKLRVAFAAATDLASRDFGSARKKVRFLATRLTALSRLLPSAVA